MVFIMRAQRVVPDIYYFIYLVRAEREIYLSGAWFQFLLLNVHKGTFPVLSFISLM
jgi:hypothetical protein